MDPLTGATAFATIVSLISQFKTEVGLTDQTDTDEFMSWLSTNKHEEIKDLLELNTNTTISIKALLNIKHDELIEKLESLDSALALYASGIPEFSDIANSLRPNNILSEQAVSILRQLDASGGSRILEGHMQAGVYLYILNGPGGQIEIDDQRFIEDDLKTLVEYGLFRHDYNSKGDNIYLLTRIASKYVAALSE